MKIPLRLKHLLPWCVAAGIFIYLFHLYPPAQVMRALQFVSLPAFLIAAIVYFLLIWLIDCWALERLISKFCHPVGFRDVWLGRGATYIIMVLNFPASQAAFAYYLKRRYDIPILTGLGMFLLLLFVDLFWLITIAFIGSFFQEYAIAGISLQRLVQMMAIIFFAGAFIWLAFWRRWPERVIGRHLRIPLIETLRNRSVFNAFQQATMKDYLWLAGMRLPMHALIILSMYVALLTFQTHIPLTRILGNLPVIFLISSLPITPGGLGMSTMLCMQLLHPYLKSSIFDQGLISPRDLIFSATLLWECVNYGLKFLAGLIIFHWVSRKLFQPTKDVSEERAEHEAAHLGGNY